TGKSNVPRASWASFANAARGVRLITCPESGGVSRHLAGRCAREGAGCLRRPTAGPRGAPSSSRRRWTRSSSLLTKGVPSPAWIGTIFRSLHRDGSWATTGWAGQCHDLHGATPHLCTLGPLSDRPGSSMGEGDDRETRDGVG